MNTEKQEWPESLSRGEGTPDADPQIISRRGQVLGILVGALLVAEVSKDLVFSSDLGEWLPACTFLYFGAIAGLPFLLARVAPKAASFDTQWLPSSRWHWAWWVGMLFLLLVSTALVAALAATIVGRPPPSPWTGPITPIGVVLHGIAIVLIGPVAEEILFRGYLLEQLRKLTRSGTALFIQSLLFGLSHLYARGIVTSSALFTLFNTFFWGMILGAWRIKFRSLLPLIVAHVLVNCVAIIPLKARYDQAIARWSPTISKETTYITEPLRKGGYPDYVAALNERASEGVTPENNSAVLFWKAVGPGEIVPEYRQRYFDMLGIPCLPEKGEYFVDLEKYLAGQKDGEKPGDAASQPRAEHSAYDLLDPALKRPWARQEFPVFAAWLDANEKPLALLVEASKRPRRYDPLVCGDRTPLIAVLQPALSGFHRAGNVASALVARAMLRLSEGRVDEAWDDLLTCHRLARLVGQGPTTIDAVLARSLDGKACAGLQAFLQHASLATAQIARMREELDRLPPMPKTGETFDVAERFEYLDNVLRFSSGGAKATLLGFQQAAAMMESEEWKGLEDEEGKRLEGTIQSLVRYSDGKPVDWELILRMGNSWFDRIADAHRKPTRAAQKEALRKLDDDLRKLKATAEDTASLDKSMLADPGKAFSERLGQVILVKFSPSIGLDRSFEDRTAMTFELTKLAFALAAYRADHGSYPGKLAELAPEYVREMPKDIFGDAEPRYRQEGKGYVLYSVGSNGKDDGGRGFENGRKEDEVVNKDWDDLVVRMPIGARQSTP